MSSIRTVYIRKADPSKKNKDVITTHQVWDIDRFLKSQAEQHMPSDKTKAEDVRVISVATEDEYRAYRGYKGY